MGFATNYENLNDNEILPVGSYEVIIKSAVPAETKSGKSMLDIRMVVRNDVEQKYKNRYIFHSLWKRKEPTQMDMQVDGYSFKQLMSLAKAVRLPSGKDYATVDDLCKDFVNKVCKVDIIHEPDTNDPKIIRAKVSFCKETGYPDCKHVFAAPAAAVTNSTYQPPKQDAFAPPSAVNLNTDDFEEIISNDDLPF